MGQCYITRRGTKTGGATEQLGIYPTGNDGRPIGNVTVLDNVMTLSSHLFQDNANVLNVCLPNTLYSIETKSFQNCASLQEIDIPDKISVIPANCFENDTSLSKVKLPLGLSTIKEYAFSGCTKLFDMKISDNISDFLVIESYAFRNCKINNETVTKLATRVNGSIYHYAFAGLTNITEITTQYTSDYYFKDCSNLRKVTILKPLSNGGFGSNVFNNCISLNEVILPENATQIYTSMFNGNEALKKVNIPKSCTLIGSSAFRYTGITNIQIPSSLTEIGDYAFSNCKNLETINYDADNLINLRQYCFADCPKLTDEDVENILAHSNIIYNDIFYNCIGLKHLNINTIWTSMFEKCTELISVTLKYNGASTGDRCFYSCTSLREAYFEGNFTTIGSCVFYNCTSLKKVFLSSSITTAINSCLTSTSSSYYIFYNCTALEDVQLGEDWNMSIRLNVSDKLTVNSMVTMFEVLKDLTGQTAKTLTLGSTNLAKLTDEQKAIAINKNWTLA